MQVIQYAAPNPSFGYYRGAPTAVAEGTGGGQQMAGTNIFAQGTGPIGQASGWTPTVLYLFVLILAEMLVFGLIGRHL